MTDLDLSQLDRVCGGAGPWKAIATGVGSAALLATPVVLSTPDPTARLQIGTGVLTWGAGLGWIGHMLRKRLP